MSKLFNFKEWLTIKDTARHLSIIFDEEVTEADVLRLALDGRLKLSTYFVNHADARKGKVVSYEEAEWFDFGPEIGNLLPNAPEEQKKKPVRYLKSLHIGGERFLNLDDKVTTLQGVWDLPMIGNERLDVEHEYQNLTNGPAVTLQGLDGAFVEGEDGSICQLQESFDDNEYQSGSMAALEKLKEYIFENKIDEDREKELLDKHKEQRKEYLDQKRSSDRSEDFYPAGGLPHDSILVVRTRILREFEKSLCQEDIQNNLPLEEKAPQLDEIPLLRESTYWVSLTNMAIKAVKEYPDWKNTQRQVQKTANLMDWLKNTIGADNREGEILKKVLSDFFNELR